MAKKIDEIEIDLDKDVLLGWEVTRSRDPSDVAFYVRKNLNGEVAPAIDVVREEGDYFLLFGEAGYRGPSENFDPQYGGHRRSISAVISGKRIMKANLFDSHRAHIYCPTYPVQDIVLDTSFVNPRALEIVSNFPKDVFFRFISRCSYDSPFSRKLFESEEVRSKYCLKREHFLSQ